VDLWEGTTTHGGYRYRSVQTLSEEDQRTPHASNPRTIPRQDRGVAGFF
jgi:hypothetical protein